MHLTVIGTLFRTENINCPKDSLCVLEFFLENNQVIVTVQTVPQYYCESYAS